LPVPRPTAPGGSTSRSRPALATDPTIPCWSPAPRWTGRMGAGGSVPSWWARRRSGRRQRTA